MTILRTIVSIALVTILALAAGCGQGKGKDKSTPEASPIRVRVGVDVAVRRDLKDKRVFVGVLEPLKQADLAPGAPGRIRRIPVEVGDYVNAGAPVVVMDDATLVATEAQFQTVKAHYERSKRLNESNVLPRAQFEGSEAQYLAMKRQLEQIEENTTIRAPFAGVVTARNAEAGELYAMGIPTMGGGGSGVVQLTQLNPLKVDLNVDEQTIRHLRKGMEVAMRVTALEDSLVTAKVEWVNPGANAMSHTFVVRIVVPNSRNVLKPGYFVDVDIVVEAREAVLAVPAAAVLGDKVLVVERDSLAVARAVQTGWRTGDFVEIVSGVKEGEVVVVSGNKALPDSSAVRLDTAATTR